jgi:hypothetical protein
MRRVVDFLSGSGEMMMRWCRKERFVMSKGIGKGAYNNATILEVCISVFRSRNGFCIYCKCVIKI